MKPTRKGLKPTRESKGEEMDRFLERLSDENMGLLFPEELISYDLKKGGFDCKDVRVKRLISLAAQRFLGEVCDSCNKEFSATIREKKDRKKRTLTLDILVKGLFENGIDIKKPVYFADKPTRPSAGKRS